MIVRAITSSLFLLFSCVFVIAATAASALNDCFLLTISVESEATPGEVSTIAQYDSEALEAFTAHSFTTRTNWTPGAHVFTGVRLLDILEANGITEGEIELVAVNDYRVLLDVEDPTNEGALLAYLMDGEPMSYRDKGPVWLVYDYDSDPTYRTETIYSRSIWQLDRIIVSR